jgi:hypothetical protein
MDAVPAEPARPSSIYPLPCRQDGAGAMKGWAKPVCFHPRWPLTVALRHAGACRTALRLARDPAGPAGPGARLGREP